MKKYILIYFVLLMLLILPGCESNNSEDLSLQVENLQSEVKLLKSEINEVKNEKEKLESKLNTIKEEEELKEEEVLVEVIDKVNQSKDTNNWVFSDSINLHTSITNNSEKDIKGIQGSIDVQDMFGVSILKVGCDLTGNVIGSGEIFINKDMSFEINEFMDDHIKFYTTDFEDLNMIYTVNKIMFTDGTIKE